MRIKLPFNPVERLNYCLLSLNSRLVNPVNNICAGAGKDVLQLGKGKLYFKLTAPDNGRAIVMLHSVEPFTHQGAALTPIIHHLFYTGIGQYPVFMFKKCCSQCRNVRFENKDVRFESDIPCLPPYICDKVSHLYS